MPDIFISKKKASAPKRTEPAAAGPSEVPKGEARHQLPGHTHNPLAAYCYHPDRAAFENQESKEHIVLLLRRHPITNLRWISVFVLMIVAPIVLSSFPLLDFLPGNFRFIAILGWYLVAFAFALVGFLTWFFNVNIITDERVVDIDFFNLIYKEVSDTKIDKIQDVTYKMGGAIRTVFNYGDVLVQTAGEEANFEFLAVPKPDRVSRVLQDLMIEEEQEKIEGRIR